MPKDTPKPQQQRGTKKATAPPKKKGRPIGGKVLPRMNMG